jgi:hypothetical protein
MQLIRECVSIGTSLTINGTTLNTYWFCIRTDFAYLTLKLTRKILLKKEDNLYLLSVYHIMENVYL